MENNTKVFFAHGKLMLTGEYFVLDGANALALPTKKGQRLEFTSNTEKWIERLTERSRSQLLWKSFDHLGNIWFETEIDCQTLSTSNKNPVGKTLQEILVKARALNPNFLHEGGIVEVYSDFNLQWGFGSSSTLISLIAQWAGVDPYELQFECFGGSGYDIACATAKGPIVYQKLTIPTATSVSFNPVFKDALYFVYLGKKQNSREAIAYYKSIDNLAKQQTITALNTITEAILTSVDIGSFCKLLKQHETIISNALKLQTVQDRLFSDFDGQIKSLGAWGGDFVMVASRLSPSDTDAYFTTKGFTTMLPFSEVV